MVTQGVASRPFALPLEVAIFHPKKPSLRVIPVPAFEVKVVKGSHVLNPDPAYEARESLDATTRRIHSG